MSSKHGQCYLCKKRKSDVARYGHVVWAVNGSVRRVQTCKQCWDDLAARGREKDARACMGCGRMVVKRLAIATLAGEQLVCAVCFDRGAPRPRTSDTIGGEA